MDANDGVDVQRDKDTPMSPKFARALKCLVGKTLAHVVVKEGKGPTGQLFLVFTDGTYFEFYSGASITGRRAVDVGGREDVLAYMAPGQAVVFEC